MTWALHRAGIRFLTHYLDDFLFLVLLQEGDRSSTHAWQGQCLLLWVCQWQENKTESPSSVITFLGVVINTAAGELRPSQGQTREASRFNLEME